MNELFAKLNAVPLYLYAGAILLFIAVMCVVFLVKAYRAGVALGMDKRMLRRSATSSATFSVLPSVSILLGVIALSGTLGLPLSWLRLSVIGALQYELNVAEIAAQNVGMSGLRLAEMDLSRFATIALVMTTGILGGALASLFFLKPYLRKIQGKPADSLGTPQKSYGQVAMVAMFIGLCSAYIASYIGQLVTQGVFLPLFTAACAALFMALFEFFTKRRGLSWLENFSVAGSMLLAMTAAVLLNLLLGGAI